MANKAKVMDSVRNYLLKLKALDGDLPEELAQDALEMTEEIKDALCEDEEGTTETEVEEKEEKETEDEGACLEEKIQKAVEDSIGKYLRKVGLVKDNALSSLDELEEEMAKEEVTDVDGEEAVTVDPEKINDSARRELLRQVKPIIAGVKDSTKRKKLADSFAKALRMNTTTTNDYSSVYNMTLKTTPKAKDSATRVSDEDFGMEIARKYNPHYKEEK